MEHKRTIAFIRPATPGIKLVNYWGKRVYITGEEAVDPRWTKIPVITFKSLEVVSE